jgi:hypothetical protein
MSSPTVNQLRMFAMFAALAPLCVACSSSKSGATPDAGDDVGASDAEAGSEAGAEGGIEASPSGDASEDSPAPVDTDGDALTILNYNGWCSITVNGGTPSMAPTITAYVPPGSTATLVARSAPGMSFPLGTDPWFGIDPPGSEAGGAPGDDSGEDASNDAPDAYGGPLSGVHSGTDSSETSTGMVTMEGDRCVSVCCGYPPSNCPASNPCP